MKKLFISILFVLLLVGCGPTPNNIAISVNQGQCLTGGIDGAPVNNPTKAQYCMSVTVQNNNKGQNANNVQVTQSGFTLNYQGLTSAGMTQYSNAICDYKASNGVCPSGTNKIGNITIYDPNNCATQQGSKVTTLMAGGGTCTLYLQIALESYAIGKYPIKLTYNYTNSNANYSIGTTIYQKVDLYAGGKTGAYVLNNFSFESALLKNVNNVSVMMRDNSGNLYFNSESIVYLYNGSTTKLLGNNLPNSISSLTIDNNSNLIAGTSAGVYYYNLNGSSNWSLLKDNNGMITPSSKILGVAYGFNISNIFYIIESNNAYACIESGISTPTMQCSLITTAGTNPQYYANSLSVYNGVLYAGVGTSLESYSLSKWTAYKVTPRLTTPSYISSMLVSSYGVLFGVNNPSIQNESAIYFCLPGVYMCVSQPSVAGNYITGNINATTMDGSGSIYGVGSNINSTDFKGVINAYGFFESQTPTAIWQPIRGAESLTTLVTVSSLVNR